MENKCLHQPSRPNFQELGDLFYRFEFQKRGTLHLHMLVWVKDISATRADLLHASLPWGNAEDAFTVASIQKSDKSCLPVRDYPDSFITERNGRHTLQFQHTGHHFRIRQRGTRCTKCTWSVPKLKTTRLRYSG